jgi:hypothetical protein
MNKNAILAILRDFKNNFQDDYQIQQIGLFGSVAKDLNTENSDIDIVIKTSKADLFAMVHIKDYLEKIFNTKVDIVRYRENMNPFLKKEIDENSIYV